MQARDTTRLGRRAMLAATLGGVAAAAGALASPARVLGADGDPLLLGRENVAAAATEIRHRGAGVGLLVESETGRPVMGRAFAIGCAALTGYAGAAALAGVIGGYYGGGTGQLGTGAAGVRAIQGGDGVALDVDGKAHFSRSGVAVIPRETRFVRVDVEGLTAASFALATLQQYRPNMWVQSITVSASAASIFIYVNQRAPADTRVAWTVLD